MKHHSSNRGFSLVEVLVVITIIIVLAAIVVPVSRSMLHRAHAVTCSNNLRQIGLATQMYASDNQMTLPVTTHQRRKGGKSWTLTLQPYASGTITFKCANDEDKDRPYTYLINDFLTPNPAGAPELNYSRLAKIDTQGATLLFAEASAEYRNSDHFHFSEYHGGSVPTEEFQNQVAVERHAGKSNYLFVDGHVETLDWKEVQARLSDQNRRFIDPTDPSQAPE